MKEVQTDPDVKAAHLRGLRHRAPWSASGYRGVTFDRARNRWKWEISTPAGRKGGRCDTALTAAKAYNDAVDKHWGGDGYKNPIDEVLAA